MEPPHHCGVAAKQVKQARGFTLIELMVVLAIITIISAIIVTNQGAFNRTLVLENTAYDVALTLRSAETYGLGNRVVGPIANAGYGLDFQKATPGSFTLFADTYPGVGQSGLCHPPPVSDPTGPAARPGNCIYDASQGEQVSSFTLGNGITISDFCAYTPSTLSWSCASGNLTSLDIVFSRPNPDPFMSVNGYYSATFPITKACIALTSQQGGARFVSVAASGEITANASSCP